MTTIILDLETRLDPAMGVYKPGDADAFPPPPFWEISTLAWCEVSVGAEGPVASFGVTMGEVDCLRTFSRMLVDQPRLVTWNGRRFDLPVIVARAMKHGTPIKPLVRGAYLNRYRDQHVDLMDQIACMGAGRSASQHDVARMLGLPGKHVGHGADVDSMSVEEEAAYCLDDVGQLALIHCEWVRINGYEVEPHRDAILAAINASARLQPLADFLAGRAAA